jgi:hypothetical protein
MHFKYLKKDLILLFPSYSLSGPSGPVIWPSFSFPWPLAHLPGPLVLSPFLGRSRGPARSSARSAATPSPLSRLTATGSHATGVSFPSSMPNRTRLSSTEPDAASSHEPRTESTERAPWLYKARCVALQNPFPIYSRLATAAAALNPSRRIPPSPPPQYRAVDVFPPALARW